MGSKTTWNLPVKATFSRYPDPVKMMLSKYERHSFHKGE
jgi:hypothetical protein